MLPLLNINKPLISTNIGLINTKLLVVFSLILASFSGVSAEDITPRLAVSPHTFELEVQRGEILENRIKVLNQSGMAIPMAVRITDFTAEEKTGEMLFDETLKDPSFSPRFWIKIENPNFILNPGKTETVEFKIEVPENAEPGGKYAVVLFEPQLPSYYFKEDQPRVIPIIGVLFLFSVKVEGLMRPEEPLIIVEFNIPEKFHLKKIENFLLRVVGLFSEVRAEEKEIFTIVEKSHLPFTLRIQNNDIYHFKPEGKLVILRNNGKIVGETKIERTTILPGKIRQFPLEFKPELPEKLERYLPASISNFIANNFLFGQYRAQLALTAEDPEGMPLASYGAGAVIKKDIEFWVFPWKIVLSTVFVILIFLLFLIKYRRRMKSAIKVLMKR